MLLSWWYVMHASLSRCQYLSACTRRIFSLTVWKPPHLSNTKKAALIVSPIWGMLCCILYQLCDRNRSDLPQIMFDTGCPWRIIRTYWTYGNPWWVYLGLSMLQCSIIIAVGRITFFVIIIVHGYVHYYCVATIHYLMFTAMILPLQALIKYLKTSTIMNTNPQYYNCFS